MKYIFLGAHGTGKSTLVNELNKNLNLPIVESVSRQCQSVVKKMGWEPYGDHQSEYQLMTTEFAFWDFERICEWNINCLMVRSPIDVVAYMLANKDPRVGEYVEKLIQLKTRGCFAGSTMFYLPIEFELVDDNCRPMDSEYQKLVDKYMVELANILELELIPITGSVRDRVEKCLAHIDLDVLLG